MILITRNILSKSLTEFIKRQSTIQFLAIKDDLTKILKDDVALLVRFWGYKHGEAKSRFTIRWLFGGT